MSAKIERMYNADFTETTASSKEMMSIKDRRVLAIMESTVQMVGGHYELSLPWKYEKPSLPNNRSMAVKRLDLLRRRLKKDVDLKSKYKEAVEEYISLGHAQKIRNGQVGSPVWYLPHHPLVHPQKPNKTRVVSDCAARFRNTSLNDQLLQGPDFTNSLVGVLLRFRQEQIGISADIEKMFHQVRVSPQDMHALSFLWWRGGDFSKKPEDHYMLVHLFGARSSPSCSSFSLKKTATVTVKLHKQIKEELTLLIHEVFFWTDSTIVLQYINDGHTRFQTFFANRLATIHDLSNPSQWRYVSSDLNPADIASCGLRPHERAKLKIWLECPKFLLQEEDHWPVQPHHLPEISEDDRNVKPVKKAQTYLINKI